MEQLISNGEDKTLTMSNTPKENGNGAGGTEKEKKTAPENRSRKFKLKIQGPGRRPEKENIINLSGSSVPATH